MEDHSTAPAGGASGNDIQLIHDGKALTDDALKAAGLAKVLAFVRTENSAGAVRSRRARQKAAREGSRQVNVVAPLAAHRTLKAMAAELQRGTPVTEALSELLAHEVRAMGTEVVVRVMSVQRARELDSLAEKVSTLKGWRLTMARLIRLV